MELYKIIIIIVLILVLYRCITFKSNERKAGQALPSKGRYPSSSSWKMIDSVPDHFICGIHKWVNRIGNPLKQDKGCGNCWAYASCTMVSDRFRLYRKNVLTWDPEIRELDYIDPVYAAKKIKCDGNECQEACSSQFIDDVFNKMMIESFPAYSAVRNDREDPNFKIETFYRVGAYNEDELDNNPKRIAENEEMIMKEIYLYGPITATIKIYISDDDRDLYNLKESHRVYGDWKEGPPREDDGYHSICIIGWGEMKRPYSNGIDNNPVVKYWVCRNSWGKDYCEGGFFKILRGHNAAIVESDCFGAIPKLEETHQKPTEFVLEDKDMSA